MGALFVSTRLLITALEVVTRLAAAWRVATECEVDMVECRLLACLKWGMDILNRGIPWRGTPRCMLRNSSTVVADTLLSRLWDTIPCLSRASSLHSKRLVGITGRLANIQDRKVNTFCDCSRLVRRRLASAERLHVWQRPAAGSGPAATGTADLSAAAASTWSAAKLLRAAQTETGKYFLRSTIFGCDQRRYGVWGGGGAF